jgi:hypothetical protein
MVRRRELRIDSRAIVSGWLVRYYIAGGWLEPRRGSPGCEVTVPSQLNGSPNAGARSPGVIIVPFPLQGPICQCATGPLMDALKIHHATLINSTKAQVAAECVTLELLSITYASDRA